MDAETQSAALLISRFRAAMDWMITHPDWEGSIALSISQLGLKGKRQGISFRAAALSLPLESKYEVIRDALRTNLPPPTRVESKRLATLWGDASFKAPRSSNKLGARQWNNLKSKLLLRASSRYSEYKKAQNLLYSTYTSRVDQIARTFCSNPSKLDDALQEGRIALLQSIDKIAVDQNFLSYASHWIKRRIRNFLIKEKLPVKAPINLISESLKKMNANEAPKDASVVRVLNFLLNGSVQLDAIGSENPLLGEAFSDTSFACKSSQDDLAHIESAVNQLTEKQQAVVRLRYGLSASGKFASLAEIARVTGISRQQVSQRERRALRQLATILNPLRSELLPCS